MKRAFLRQATSIEDDILALQETLKIKGCVVEDPLSREDLEDLPRYAKERIIADLFDLFASLCDDDPDDDENDDGKGDLERSDPPKRQQEEEEEEEDLER